MIAYILGACLGVYVLAFVIRGGINLAARVTKREIGKKKATYVAIGIATVGAAVLSGFGEGEIGGPDFSYAWAYLVAGAIVFLFERFRLSRRASDVEGAKAG